LAIGLYNSLYYRTSRDIKLHTDFWLALISGILSDLEPP